MRRLALTFALLTAVAAPAAAVAAQGAAVADGSLVVQNGSAPSGPVVMLHVTGSVIGRIDYGKIIIATDSGTPPEVTGAGVGVDSSRVDNARVWTDKSGTGFKFRAVGGTYTIVVYGSGVDLVALGKGYVKLAGNPDAPKSDGRYSLNGGDWVSLPGLQSDKLLFPDLG
jgi:hypothetical protein